MTLNLTIVSPHGVWQSSDCRLTDIRTGALVEERSVKHLHLRCPDGTAMIAYAGVGRVNGVEISDWLRELVRGETRGLDDTLILIRESATRDLGPYVERRYHHMFSIGAFLGGRPWIIQIRNFAAINASKIGPPIREFQTVAEAISGPGRPFVFGAHEAVSPRDRAILLKAAARRPRKPADFRRLLAGINRRAAAHPTHGHLISRHCLTSFCPPAGEPIEAEIVGLDRGMGTPLVIPMILFGIDMTDTMRALQEHIGPAGHQRDASALQERSERAGRESVTTRNRLRR